MKAIWKYPLPVHPPGQRFSIEVPADARPLALQKQLDLRTGEDIPTLWMLGTVEYSRVRQSFFWLHTGYEVTEESMRDATYAGTVQLDYGSLVLHLFEGM